MLVELHPKYNSAIKTDLVVIEPRFICVQQAKSNLLVDFR